MKVTVGRHERWGNQLPWRGQGFTTDAATAAVRLDVLLQRVPLRKPPVQTVGLSSSGPSRSMLGTARPRPVLHVCAECGYFYGFSTNLLDLYLGTY